MAFEKICDACNTGTIEPFGVANLLVEGLHNFADGMALQVAWNLNREAGVAPTLDEIQSAETLARLYARKASEWNEVDGGFSGLGIKSFLFPKGVSGG